MPRASFALVLFAVAACAPESRLVRHHTEDGVHLYQHGSYADARDCFEAALALKPGDPDLMYNLAQCQDRLGQKDKADALFQECVRIAPDHAEARHAWLEAMLRSGRDVEGRRMVADWLRSRPKSSAPYAEDAWLHARDGDPDTARGRYQQALNLDPRNARALVGLAQIYDKLDHQDRALVLYERALETNPDQPEIARLVRLRREKGMTGPRPE